MGCHFINWLVVLDAHGYITFSQTGFMGHLTDSACFDYAFVPQILVGTHIIADLGFASNPNILVPLRRCQDLPEAHRMEKNRYDY